MSFSFFVFWLPSAKIQKLKQKFGGKECFHLIQNVNAAQETWNLKRTCISFANFKLGITLSWYTVSFFNSCNSMKRTRLKTWLHPSQHSILCESYQISKVWDSGQRTPNHEFECDTGEEQSERELETILRHRVINGEGQEGKTGQQELKGNVCLTMWVLVPISRGH